MNDSEPGSGFGGLLGLGPVCELPGRTPQLPARAVAQTQARADPRRRVRADDLRAATAGASRCGSSRP